MAVPCGYFHKTNLDLYIINNIKKKVDVDLIKYSQKDEQTWSLWQYFLNRQFQRTTQKSKAGDKEIRQ
ncbi:hypothetical protein RRG08_030678 [Elysia crispata]|uniref:Uncharacterized protein n=1 Tax=Elysia crispata TaxID=231223 RepID=A0AAE1CZD5_9GAST|nr:hypothetical protein RRG08_030678 [Elysia crispata]